MLSKKILYTFLTAIFLFVMNSCGVKYGFTGGSIPEGMKTVNIQYFENIAPLVYPTLSQNFTEALKERIRNQSRLSQVNQDGDATFEGFITEYSISPAAVEAGTDRAAMNRLTITIKVTYHNKINPKDDFEQPFTRFKEFAGNLQSAQEETLGKEIIQMLTEDIYNKAFANW
ncbi:MULTISPECIES: LptE family protein [unclassified Sphingobacterium]|uniref:LptE family protein n=1 Tax=unclassified Sphingobacterium TaxID=2609468 RepID=UPI0025D5F3F7|nr:MULTISPECIES: LptE family protein [unclassified Sphingobacterium]MDR0263047.1 LPS assembly lipoprotein LptE [Sphingobacterium sp.]